jgi:hypothetical protein
MLDALEGQGSRTVQSCLQEPSPLGDQSPTVWAGTARAGNYTICDSMPPRTTGKAGESKRVFERSEIASSFRDADRKERRESEGWRPDRSSPSRRRVVHPCTAERMLLPTFRGSKVRRVRAAARVKIYHREAIQNLHSRNSSACLAGYSMPVDTQTLSLRRSSSDCGNLNLEIATPCCARFAMTRKDERFQNPNGVGVKLTPTPGCLCKERINAAVSGSGKAAYARAAGYRRTLRACWIR